MDMIQFKDVWEMYRIKFIIDGKISWDNFWALKGITFKVKKGECLGIIGENGAGKTTILRLMAGMLKPDRGQINVSGRVSGLLELGAGFEPELTGRDNIYLSASLFGLTKDQIEQGYEEIADFASLGRFINAPVKCYSQGMYVRLAFSIAIHMDPDILLIDDILAVGDEYFQSKCIKKIFELKEQGKTIVVVSHDMNMLRRLCRRAILLKDGRILKYGPIEEVMPLYTQMVGAKEGVETLSRGALNLVFNNGRAFLNWKDKLLTPNFGIYTLFRIGDKWYNSLQADWDVNKEDENNLTATGRFYQLELTQAWRMKLDRNNAILWDVEIESSPPLDIQEGYINVMLSDEYTRWFTSLERGKFPAIDKKGKGWNPLLDDSSFRSCVGVEKEGPAGSGIPTLALERSNYTPTSRAQILNSDYLSSCRILQCKIQDLGNYSATRTRVFGSFSSRIILDIPDIDEYLKKLEDEFSLSSGRLRLAFQDGQGLLFYDNIRLTEGLNASTSIYANGRWYYSHLARWEIKKEGPMKLIARGRWHNLSIAQTWEVELIDETSFSWEVYLDVEEEVDIEEERLEIACSKRYSHWFSDYGQGVFPEEFLETEADMLQRCIPDGTIGLENQNDRFPPLSIEFIGDSNSFAKIFNSDFYHRTRILRIDRVRPEEKLRCGLGRYKSFSIKAKVEDNRQIDAKESHRILQNGNLRFIFDKGSGRIYARGTELTKSLGLYTSLRSDGRWRDSYSGAIWKIEKKNKDSIGAFGKWLHLPLVQCWEILFTKEGELEFNVKMKVDEEIEVDRLQMNLMLSEKYSGWLADKKNEAFPLFKADIDDDWHCIWQGEATTQSIGVAAKSLEKEYLPSVILLPQRLNQNWRLKIINSDIYHRGRILQYLNSQKQTILPGEYPYFHGKIKTIWGNR